MEGSQRGVTTPATSFLGALLFPPLVPPPPFPPLVIPPPTGALVANGKESGQSRSFLQHFSKEWSILRSFLTNLSKAPTNYTLKCWRNDRDWPDSFASSPQPPIVVAKNQGKSRTNKRYSHFSLFIYNYLPF